MAHIAERMASHYQRADLRATRVLLPRRRSARRVPPRRAPADRVRRAARLGEDLQRGQRRARRRPGAGKAQFDDGVAAAIEITAAQRRRHRHQGAARDVGLPRRRGVLGRARADRPRRRGRSRSPARRRSRAELLEWFNAIGVPLSEIYGMSESSGPMTWTPERNKAGHVGQAIPGVRGAARRRRRGDLPRRQRVPGLPRPAREDRRDARSTAGCTPATSARSTTTATSASSTARRS